MACHRHCNVCVDDVLHEWKEDADFGTKTGRNLIVRYLAHIDDLLVIQDEEITCGN